MYLVSLHPHLWRPIEVFSGRLTRIWIILWWCSYDLFQELLRPFTILPLIQLLIWSCLKSFKTRVLVGEASSILCDQEHFENLSAHTAFLYFLGIHLHIECKKRCPDTKYYGNSSSMVHCSLFSLIIFMRLCLFILSLAYNIFWESLLIISSLRCIYGRDSKKIGIFFLSDKFLHYI